MSLTPLEQLLLSELDQHKGPTRNLARMLEQLAITYFVGWRCLNGLEHTGRIAVRRCGRGAAHPLEISVNPEDDPHG